MFCAEYPEEGYSCWMMGLLQAVHPAFVLKALEKGNEYYYFLCLTVQCWRRTCGCWWKPWMKCRWTPISLSTTRDSTRNKISPSNSTYRKGYESFGDFLHFLHNASWHIGISLSLCLSACPSVVPTNVSHCFQATHLTPHTCFFRTFVIVIIGVSIISQCIVTCTWGLDLTWWKSKQDHVISSESSISRVTEKIFVVSGQWIMCLIWQNGPKATVV